MRLDSLFLTGSGNSVEGRREEKLGKQPFSERDEKNLNRPSATDMEI